MLLRHGQLLMRGKSILRTAIAVFWLLTMGWFVRYEAFPAYFTNTLEGYREVLSEGQLFVDSWMRILYRGQPIGYSHSSVEVVDDDPLEHYRMSSRTLLQMNLMGEVQQISVLAAGGLDVMYQLQSFNFSLTARRYNLRLDGVRKGGDNFEVLIRSPSGKQKTTVVVPKDVILYSPMTDLAMRNLAIGSSLRVRTLDPASMSVIDIIVTALRKETIRVNDADHEATVLSVDYQGMKTLSWIDAQGKVLRQETPLGWTLEACDAEDAMAMTFDPGQAQDMLAASAVPSEGTIRDPDACKEVVLALDDLPVDFALPDSSRQTVLSRTGTVASVRLARATWPVGAAEEPVDMSPWLAATPFVQSDHARMRETARGIVDPTADRKSQVAALYNWVFSNVAKRPTVSLPSALDVLEQLEGDCNEHTYLFVALARALGIPARICIGLLYNEGAWYYHAWPAVYDGGWVELDPTKGDELVGPTHLMLLEGELSDQLKLMSIFGRLKARIVEQTY